MVEMEPETDRASLDPSRDDVPARAHGGTGGTWKESRVLGFGPGGSGSRYGFLADFRW